MIMPKNMYYRHYHHKLSSSFQIKTIVPKADTAAGTQKTGCDW